MNKQIFTFWEGPMPAYIKLCMSTWKFQYTILTYDNLSQYTDVNLNNKDKFTLPQIADCIRVHVLRDHGGCWLDADTILLSTNLPDVSILGNPETRSNTIGFLRTEAYSDMFTSWAKFQDEILCQEDPSTSWDVVGNAFTDTHLKEHTEISIGDINRYWPELNLDEDISRRDKYRKFYFEYQFTLEDINKTDMLMLHNSWTPKWYKQLSYDTVLSENCTLSNILKELV